MLIAENGSESKVYFTGNSASRSKVTFLTAAFPIRPHLLGNLLNLVAKDRTESRSNTVLKTATSNNFQLIHYSESNKHYCYLVLQDKIRYFENHLEHRLSFTGTSY